LSGRLGCERVARTHAASEGSQPLFARVASYEIDLENFGPVAEWFNEHG
jgi:ribosomal protein S3